VREKVLQYIREQRLLGAGDRLAVAVSGGADSVALLRLLLELKAELGVVLFVAHFNHSLRGDQSDADGAFVAKLATEHRTELFVGRGDVREHARASKLSLEAAAREMRYRWFAEIAEKQRLNAVATAHTLDDQAETVLLKFLRGAGTRGLAGIYPVRRLAGSYDSGARVVRPLLAVTRKDIEEYLTALGQTWREDETNLDRRFLRNRVRHDLLPLLKRDFNPNVGEALSALAEISRGEEDFWRELVEREIGERADGEIRTPEKSISGSLESGVAARLDLSSFARQPIALQRRLVKRFAEAQRLMLDFEHIERLRHCALGECGKVELPGGVVALVSGSSLVLGKFEPSPGCAYSYLLPVPGEVVIREAGLRLRAYVVASDFPQETDPETLLSLDLVGPQLTVRNWTPGDRFWPAHSRSDEKLKRLFAEKRVPAAERSSWPVVLSGDKIVWVKGFPITQTHRWTGIGAAVRIDSVPVKTDK
jgi:tRNA(Ile)-lysidine synthase